MNLPQKRPGGTAAAVPSNPVPVAPVAGIPDAGVCGGSICSPLTERRTPELLPLATANGWLS